MWLAGQKVTAGTLDDVTMQVTTTAGLASLNPVQGMPAWLTDTSSLALYTGSGWAYPTIQIAAHTVASATASVTFSGIPSFTNLSLIWKGRGDTATAATPLELQINGITSSSSYVYQDIEANGTTVTGKNSAGTVNAIQVATMTAGTANSGYFGCGRILFPNAADNTNHQVCTAVGYAPMSATAAYTGIYSGLASTGAVSSITLFPLAGNFSAGEFCLYGWM